MHILELKLYLSINLRSVMKNYKLYNLKSLYSLKRKQDMQT